MRNSPQANSHAALLLGVGPAKLWFVKAVDAFPTILQLQAALALSTACHSVLLAVMVGDMAAYRGWGSPDSRICLHWLLMATFTLRGWGGLCGTEEWSKGWSICKPEGAVLSPARASELHWNRGMCLCEALFQLMKSGYVPKTTKIQEKYYFNKLLIWEGRKQWEPKNVSFSDIGNIDVMSWKLLSAVGSTS